MTSTDTAGQVEARAKAHWEHRRDRWTNPFPVRVAEWEELPDDFRNLEIAATQAADRLACGGGEVEVCRACGSTRGWYTSYSGGVAHPLPCPDCNPSGLSEATIAARQSPAPATQAAGGGAVEGRVWFEVRDRNCVPDCKGPFPHSRATDFMRELMAARPTSYITVVTVDESGPLFQDGPEWLMMADGRSRSTALAHIARLHAILSPASKVQTAGDEGVVPSDEQVIRDAIAAWDEIYPLLPPPINGEVTRAEDLEFGPLANLRSLANRLAALQGKTQ